MDAERQRAHKAEAKAVDAADGHTPSQTKPNQTTIPTYVLGWLATSSGDGRPNVSPKEIWRFDGVSKLVIANIASPVSERNILSNPSVCFSFVDVFLQKGLKLEGVASVVPPQSELFMPVAAPLIEMCHGRFEIRNVFQVAVSEATLILAPSYLFHRHETTEAEQITAAMRAYGVSPLK